MTTLTTPVNPRIELARTRRMLEDTAARRRARHPRQPHRRSRFIAALDRRGAQYLGRARLAPLGPGAADRRGRTQRHRPGCLGTGGLNAQAPARATARAPSSPVPGGARVVLRARSHLTRLSPRRARMHTHGHASRRSPGPRRRLRGELRRAHRAASRSSTARSPTVPSARPALPPNPSAAPTTRSPAASTRPSASPAAPRAGSPGSRRRAPARPTHPRSPRQPTAERAARRAQRRVRRHVHERHRALSPRARGPRAGP